MGELASMNKLNNRTKAVEIAADERMRQRMILKDRENLL